MKPFSNAEEGLKSPEASHALAKVLYGSVFVVLLPISLVIFSARVEIPVRIASFPLLGGGAAGCGLIVMLWGMWDIWKRGAGLPMNAFPPRRLVTEGIYAVIPHPIYSGFAFACLGLSLRHGSATGAFLTTPLVALCAIALVLGHERPYLLRTFGALPRPFLGFWRLSAPIVSALPVRRVWARILRRTDKLANSWNSWRLGPLRVINHAVFAGVAGGAGVFLVVLLAGPEHIPAICIVTLAGLAGAAVIGQLLVGSSSRLSRAFGYFGGLLGIAVAGLALWPFNSSMLLVLAAFAFAGPWTQAIGRLRCLVQGCCHGAPCAKEAGIVVNNAHSRVSALAGLGGRPIYPTQLYSILGNLAIGPVLVWLWCLAAPLALIGGLYLLLAGLVRFIEEGYRGEPLTRIIGGLHIYQWFAIGMAVSGMFVMAIASPSAPPPNTASLAPALGTGLVFFVVCGFAMGVDFPGSRRMFSRLSG